MEQSPLEKRTLPVEQGLPEKRALSVEQGPPEKRVLCMVQSQSRQERLREIRQQLRKDLLERIDLSREVGDDELLALLDRLLQNKCRECFIGVADRIRLRRDIFNSLRRMDILQELLEQDDITEIMVNGANDIFLERDGKTARYEGSFESEQKLADVVQQMASGSNRIINESNPIVDTRLPCGSRVSIVLPPVALNGPVITIRKFPKESMTMERLIELGSITTEAAAFLERLVRAGYNLFISGGTGSGKTTFLNALSNYIPSHERVITIEDSAELQIKNIPNLVRMEVRNANLEGNNAVKIRDLIKASLRMRPDRIVVGEVRGEEAIDMLQAMNTGHDGSLSTGHANSARDCLSRLETMILLGAELPLLAVRKQIASAVDIIVQLGRLRDRSRKVLEICEVRQMAEGEIVLAPLYRFVEEPGVQTGGELQAFAEGAAEPVLSGGTIGERVQPGWINKVCGTLQPTGEELQNKGKLINAGL